MLRERECVCAWESSGHAHCTLLNQASERTLVAFVPAWPVQLYSCVVVALSSLSPYSLTTHLLCICCIALDPFPFLFILCVLLITHLSLALSLLTRLAFFLSHNAAAAVWPASLSFAWVQSRQWYVIYVVVAVVFVVDASSVMLGGKINITFFFHGSELRAGQSFQLCCQWNITI